MKLHLIRRAAVPAALAVMVVSSGASTALADSSSSPTRSASSATPSPDDTPTPTPTVESPPPVHVPPVNKPPTTVNPAKPLPPPPPAPPAPPAKVKDPKKPEAKKPAPSGPQAPNWAAQGIEHLGPKGIDVSGWQHPGDAAIDWKAVKAAGVEWAYVKCTDGGGTGNFTVWGPRDVTAAQAVGIHAGCYHYAQPGATSKDLAADAKAQADAALAASPPSLQAHLPVTLDLEETGSLSNPELATWTVAFLTEVQAHSTRAPWIYASSNFLIEHLGNVTALKPFPVWVAAYGLNYKKAPPIPTWAKAIAWQFSSIGAIPGIPTSDSDLDVFLLPRKMLYPVAHPQAPAPVAPNPGPALQLGVTGPAEQDLPLPQPSPGLSAAPLGHP